MNLNRIREIGNKVLLLSELPFYPIVYARLLRKLGSKEGRTSMYLSTKGYVPFRRLHLFILDRMFVKEVRGYNIPSYNKDLAGFILDLKHHVANRYFINRAFSSNYVYALARIKKILNEPNHGVSHIIDVGAGSGVLTKAIAESVSSEIKTIGIEIRKETVECNRTMYPSIRWEEMSKLSDLVTDFGAEHCIIVMNGVINFMMEDELRKLLSYRAKHIVWFYQTSVSSRTELEKLSLKVMPGGHEGYVHYNLGLFLKEYGYSFDFEFIRAQSGGFVSATSSC